MPGIATHFKMLDLTIKKFDASGNSQLQQISAAMKAEPTYAYLGCIGPALADFIPSDPPPEGPASIGYGNFFTSIWKGAFKIVSGDGTDADPGLLRILDSFNAFFDKIQPILDSEDLLGLKAMRDAGEIDTITNMAGALANTVVGLTAPGGYITDITGYIGEGMKPTVNMNPGNPIASPDAWSPRDYLFWQKTGDFTDALVKRAESSGNPKFIAYAYGYVSGYAGYVAGSSFVNNVIGGTYRSDWWRYRWINNFVDAWVYGYYETGASISGDNPSPAYTEWKNLCGSKLYLKIDLPGIDPIAVMQNLAKGEPFPAIVDPGFDAFWYGAFEQVYGPRSISSRFKPNSINGAYLMTWLMLWFQTSGKVVGCNKAPNMQPPEGAGDTPSWVDPAIPGDNGAGNVPPTPTVEDDVDEGQIITGILLALLGLGTFATGGFIAGGAAVAFGVEQVILGASDINWTKLRADVYWYRMYLYNGLKALHEIMVLGALQHPYSEALEIGESVTLLGFPFTFDSAVVNCKTKSDKKFPIIPWDGDVGITSLWLNAPSRSIEEPATTAYLAGSKYPNFFIDDPANPLSNGDIKNKNPVVLNTDGGAFRNNPGVSGANAPVLFGNVIDNTADLFLARTFPNWNLDQDRGQGYLTWKFKTNYSNPVVIEPI